MLKIGSSKVCITPPVGIDLSGYGWREQPSIGVHDDLYVRGLYLTDGSEKLLWLHCDLLGLSRNQVQRLRKSIVRERGLEERQVVVSTTHTHAGPSTQRLRGCGEMNAEYLRTLDKHLLEAARQALTNLEEAELWFAQGECSMGIDRRQKPSAHADTRIPVLAFKRPDGTFLVVVSNYAVHNVAFTHKNRLVSADMAGVVARCVQDQLPGEPITLFTNGACGNINPPRQSDDASAAEEFGVQLGTAVVSLAHQAKRCKDPMLSSRLQTIAVPLTTQNPEQVEQEYQRTVMATPDPWTSVVMKEWRDETLAIIDQCEVPDHVQSEVQVFRIGPASFAALGAEVFSRMADELRAYHGENTYVLGYAGGNIGYLPPYDAYAEGGYEVNFAYKIYTNFNVAPGGFELLRDKSVELLDELKKDLSVDGKQT